MAIQSVRVTPASTIGPQVNYTLVGHTVSGWGFSNATMTEPGPHITVYLGDVVTLTLIGNDSNTPHNWFIDYNNDSQPSPGEPSSPNFNGLGAPKIIVWNFTADRPGTWTYRCLFHPSLMTGTLDVLPDGRPLNASLSGNAVRGWGETNATIANPGPEIIVGVGALVTLTLIGNDSNTPHNWFIDYNNDSQPSPGEPSSPDFNAPSGPKIIVWNFTAAQPGQFTYRCQHHPTTMTGTIIILGEVRPTGSPGLALIPGILLTALGAVLVVAAIYHVRAVRAAKRAK
jgi:plastocyanin